LSALEKDFRATGQATDIEAARADFVEAYEAILTALEQRECE
jgi:hypothetical protein